VLYNSGRNAPDIKVTKSLGGFPYTNLFVITGVIRELESYYQLTSPLGDIATLPHNQLTSASTVFVASTSNLDNVTGIGARVVIVSGLDINFFVIEEVVILDGQNPVETNSIFSKVFEIVIIQFGTNVDSDTGDSVSVGDIYVGTGAFLNGIPAKAIVGISQAENNPNSRDAIFTVPDGKILLLKSLFCGTEPDILQNTGLVVQVGIKIFGFPDTFWFKTEPYTFDATFQYVLEFNLPIPPRSDIQIRAKSTTNKTKISTMTLEVELRDLR
jgi:hypothetical protein